MPPSASTILKAGTSLSPIRNTNLLDGCGTSWKVRNGTKVTGFGTITSALDATPTCIVATWIFWLLSPYSLISMRPVRRSWPINITVSSASGGAREILVIMDVLMPFRALSGLKVILIVSVLAFSGFVFGSMIFRPICSIASWKRSKRAPPHRLSRLILGMLHSSFLR